MQVQGFGGCAGVLFHVQALFFAAGVAKLQCLLAVVVDGEVAHRLEHVAQLGLEGELEQWG
ncbi:hypothetical protein D3C79_1040590 [compost metagenome]